MIQRPPSIATGRLDSFLKADMERHRLDMQKQLHGARVCVIGGAGSIGRQTVLQLSRYDISELVIMDQDENGLANLTRTLQSAPEKPKPRTISTLPFDFASTIAAQYFDAHPGFDFMLNFAALKHVRSEKNAFTALALLATNTLKQHALLARLSDKPKVADYFAVSTDKAANPVSIMGASKRLMEHVLFGSSMGSAYQGRKVSARFANVAYSSGSLLESFALRLEAGVPLAAPVGISRYFVSEQEAGELCMLASLLGEPDNILIPKLSAEENLIAVEEIARRFLEANGYEADVFTLDEEADAKSAVDSLSAVGKWPLILTPADTAGEKSFEEFAGSGEAPQISEFHELLTIPYSTHLTSSEIDASLAALDAMVAGSDDEPLSIARLISIISELEPSFAQAHRASAKQLDDRI